MAQVTFLITGDTLTQVEGGAWAMVNPGKVHFPITDFPATLTCAIGFGIRKAPGEKVTFTIEVVDTVDKSVRTAWPKPLSGQFITMAIGPDEQVFRRDFYRLLNVELRFTVPGTYTVIAQLNGQEAARTDIHVLDAATLQ